MPNELDQTQDPTPIPTPIPTPNPNNPAERPPGDDSSPRESSKKDTTRTPRTAREQPRFNPGDTLADRYRIVAFLGRGGMGEVYRADDLELAQSVAIKLLPARIAADADLTERVRAEVRLARGISHKNVCRIHDIARLPAEQGGDLFISMEYIDGEDLQTLLRRIGKLPQDKAVDVARQLCAALAAAHDQGVIHRDLKPANIMLDGRGNARLTDFGIAAIDHELAGTDAHAGTPAYMAPEQFDGREVSKRSDIYALGLVIFELLTGKPAWKAHTYAELKTLRQAGTTPANITSISTAGVDPALAALVERCTETDPADRPASALAVAAALPGADPVAAAIAAGETPSPELIAASGGRGALRPAAAATLALVSVALTLVCVILSRGTTLLTIAPPPDAPPLMKEAAFDILKELGHTAALNTDQPPPTRTGWSIAGRTLDRVAKAISAGDADSWDALADPFANPIRFWLRIEPDGFEPISPDFGVSTEDPPLITPGAAMITLDGDRRLRALRVIAATNPAATDQPDQDPDWSRAFTRAGLDIANFEPIDAVRRLGTDADTRRGWRGTTPDENPQLTPLTIDVFAGAADGAITEFSIEQAQNKTNPDAGTTPSPSVTRGINPDSATAQLIANSARIIVMLLVTIVAGTLAYRNYRLGRCDLRRATRLGLTVFVLSTIGAVLNADVAPVNLRALIGPFPIYAGGLGFALVFVACYIAAEPLARSRWPGSLVSWTRLFGGNVTDPMIGRDLLIGLTIGTATAAVTVIAQAAAPLIGPDTAPPTAASATIALSGVAPMLALCFEQATGSLINAAATAFLVLIIMLLFGLIKIKRRWPAIVFVVLLVIAQTLVIPGIGPLDRLAILVAIASVIIVLDRAGLLAAAAALASSNIVVFLVNAAPGGNPLDYWWSPAAFTPAAVLLAATAFAYRTSTAGASLFSISTRERPPQQ